MRRLAELAEIQVVQRIAAGQIETPKFGTAMVNDVEIDVGHASILRQIQMTQDDKFI